MTIAAGPNADEAACFAAVTALAAPWMVCRPSLGIADSFLASSTRKTSSELIRYFKLLFCEREARSIELLKLGNAAYEFKGN